LKKLENTHSQTPVATTLLQNKKKETKVWRGARKSSLRKQESKEKAAEGQDATLTQDMFVFRDPMPDRFP